MERYKSHSNFSLILSQDSTFHNFYAFFCTTVYQLNINVRELNWYTIQIMNVYESNGKNIFMRGKIDCSIQRGDSRVELSNNRSPNENILTIA